jgi:hypothetical protein
MSAHNYVPNDAGSKGFALFCRLGSGDGWEQGLGFIEGAGFRLNAPHNAEKIITIEPTGDRSDRSLAEFRQLTTAGAPLIFRIWTEEGDDDMLCEFRRQDSIEIELYWFGQLEWADEQFVSALLKRFEAVVKTGPTAVIVDWHALSENFDWVAFLGERVGYSGVPPEVIGLPSTFASRVRLDLQGFSEMKLGDHVLYTRDTPPTQSPEPPEEIAHLGVANPDVGP